MSAASGELGRVYDEDFFAGQVAGSADAAAIVVPIVRELVPGIASVVDIGCGAGAWLAAFHAAGARDILGLDGGAPAETLAIAPAAFQSVDLERPIRLNRRFDLAVSLEVAEHLPPERGPGLVADLVALADLVLFSAALPGQGGTSHINERPASYWAGLFAAHCYQPRDLIRPRIWGIEKIPFWYRQNIFIYGNAAGLARLAADAASRGWPVDAAADLIHPEIFGFHYAELAERRRAETASTLYLRRLDRQVRTLEHRSMSYAVERDAARYDVRMGMAKLAEKDAEIALLEARLKAADALLKEYFESPSYRLTAPLRRLAGRHR